MIGKQHRLSTSVICSYLHCNHAAAGACFEEIRLRFESNVRDVSCVRDERFTTRPCLPVDASLRTSAMRGAATFSAITGPFLVIERSSFSILLLSTFNLSRTTAETLFGKRL